MAGRRQQGAARRVVVAAVVAAAAVVEEGDCVVDEKFHNFDVTFALGAVSF